MTSPFDLSPIRERVNGLKKYGWQDGLIVADFDALLQECDRLRAVEQPTQGWLLIERWKDGSEHIEGIALTHESKDRWMRGDYEVGQSRTALRYKILAPLPSAPVENP